MQDSTKSRAMSDGRISCSCVHEKFRVQQEGVAMCVEERSWPSQWEWGLPLRLL